MKKHALITGGAGFVGSHLSDELLRRGYSVTVIDDLSTGSMRNIQHLKAAPDFHYVIDTMMKSSLLAELVDEADVIFHLAAAVGVRLIVESPVRTLDTNIRATELVLHAAAKKKKKVLLTSTSEVYGKSSKLPFQEEDDLVMGPPVRGRWSYACSKAIDEFFALAFHREKGLPVVIVRLFNTVGPRQTGTYGMVLPRFIQQALTGEAITIYGTGTQSRCFAYVGDVVRALAELVESPTAEGRIFNIGTEEEITISQLASLVKRTTGSDAPIRHLTYEEAYGSGFEDMMRRIPDLTRIREEIGYRPTKNIQQIVETMVESYSFNGFHPHALAAGV